MKWVSKTSDCVWVTWVIVRIVCEWMWMTWGEWVKWMCFPRLALRVWIAELGVISLLFGHYMTRKVLHIVSVSQQLAFMALLSILTQHTIVLCHPHFSVWSCTVIAIINMNIIYLVHGLYNEIFTFKFFSLFNSGVEIDSFIWIQDTCYRRFKVHCLRVCCLPFHLNQVVYFFSSKWCLCRCCEHWNVVETLRKLFQSFQFYLSLISPILSHT